MKSFPGFMSSDLTAMAARPPTMKKRITEARYMIPSLLWSTVQSQELSPFLATR
jgi:hypothetical protein